MKIDPWKIKLDERDALAAKCSITEKCLSEGIRTSNFEKKIASFLGRKYAICVPSGTAALLLALMGIGLRPGDEVIVPDLTFIATAHAPYLLGAKVVLADTREDVPLMDMDRVLELITNKTRAILPVHLNGRHAETKRLKEALRGTNIYIIDDACQAFGSGTYGNYVGKYADIACYSFSVMKIMTTGQGGVLTTDDYTLYERMKCQKTHGMGIDNIFESAHYPMPGINFKYSDILASIGLNQLGRIEEKMTNTRNNYMMYRDGLKNIDECSMIPTRDDEVVLTPDILCNDVKRMRRVLHENEIGTRPAACCLHNAAYLEKRTQYNNAQFFSNHILFLPGGPDQPRENITTVIDCISKEFSDMQSNRTI